MATETTEHTDPNPWLVRGGVEGMNLFLGSPEMSKREEEFLLLGDDS